MIKGARMKHPDFMVTQIMGHEFVIIEGKPFFYESVWKPCNPQLFLMEEKYAS